MTEHIQYPFLSRSLQSASQARANLNEHYHADETSLVKQLLAESHFDPEATARINEFAQTLVRRVRARKSEQGALDAFMQEYDLWSLLTMTQVDEALVVESSYWITRSVTVFQDL